MMRGAMGDRGTIPTMHDGKREALGPEDVGRS